MTIEIVDPRGPAVARSLSLAPRVPRPELRRVGLLCNDPSVAHGTHHFARYLRVVRRALTDRLGPVEFHQETKPVLTRPAEQRQLDRFHGWQAVVNGLGK